ncbi:DUF6296 family protein [Kitasatospora sp. NBC_01287]|uniref:DUF6296 family protein n=1 Tax=Kitasatospora sp. NBC_01287 TaxID=2903573 RepID=UPI00225375B7|nr:DUF6296 family protein [Kitasatospora sp. NBC_01287]MCX4744104.1 DUF6296 family protein [Kitasatospora sp. NBC_01287]
MAEAAYELVFVRVIAGHEHEDVVRVRPVGTKGPGGHPVYADGSGAVRAEISDQGEIRMMATTGQQDLRSPTTVRRVEV